MIQKCFMEYLTKNIVATFIIIVLAVFGYFYTPKNKSSFGYKTPMALKNDNTWSYANNFAKKLFLIVAIIFIVAEALLYIYLEDDYKAYRYSFQILFISSILIIPIVEILLHLKFDKNGKSKRP